MIDFALIVEDVQMAPEKKNARKRNSSEDFCSSEGHPSRCRTDSSNIIDIHSLPDEILEHVFSFLNLKQRIQTELVCKRWRMMGIEVGWRWPQVLIFDPESKAGFKQWDMTDTILAKVLLRCGLTLKRLALARYREWNSGLTGDAVDIISRFCPNLREMDLTNIHLPNLTSQMLILRCPDLTSVQINDCGKFGEGSLSILVNGCKLLQCLEITGNGAIKGDCLRYLSGTLKSLRLKNCPSFQAQGLVRLANRCCAFEDLRLKYCNRVEPYGILKVFNKCRNTLKILHLNGYSRVIDLTGNDGISTLCNLEDLSLKACPDVSDELLQVLVKKCSKLQALNVNGTNVSDVGLSFLTSAACLKVLDVSRTPNVLGQGLEILAAQRRLEQVYIRSSLHITNEHCNGLAACPNLKILDVSGTKTISNNLLLKFQKSLEEGIIKGVVKLYVGDTSVSYTIKPCVGLEVIFSYT